MELSDEEELRYWCLQLAVSKNDIGILNIPIADAYYDFVKTGEVLPLDKVESAIDRGREDENKTS